MDPQPGPRTASAHTAHEGIVAGAGPSFASRLEAWVADAVVERSADARAREHWLRTAAEADATFAGVLLDLAERGVGLAVATVAGRRWQGVVEGLGADFVALVVGSGQRVLVAMGAIASVRTASSVGVAAGERPVTTDLCLAEVLGSLAAERERVRITTLDGSEAVSGELRSTGIDVVTVRGDGDAPGTAYVRTAAIADVVVA